ncbi:MAG: GHKL domain-containing protein [Bacilli bacterium]|jgi:two-component system sensor histidine kinase AgrC
MPVLKLFFSVLIYTFFLVWLGSSFLQKVNYLKKGKSIFIIILLTIINFFIFFNTTCLLRVFLFCFFTTLAFVIIFNERIKKSLMITLIVFIFLFLATCIINCFFIIINYEINDELIKEVWVNIPLIFTVLLLRKIKIFNDFIEKTILFNKKIINDYVFITTLVIIIGILSYRNYYYFGFSYDYFINLFLIVLFGYIIFLFLKEQENNNQLVKRHDQLFNYLTKYEEELNSKNMIIHEFKNQIVVIKGFINKNNKEALDYISNIMMEMRKIENKTFENMDKIPKGGFKGLLYYKLGNLNEEGIKVYINVGKEIKKNLFQKLPMEVNGNLTKIIGVYLDNAIEGARISKKKIIIVELYFRKNTLIVQISNTYKGRIDLDKIKKMGYSTKGEGRGYGLPIVIKLIKKYKNFKKEIKIEGEYFVSSLEINIKDY